MLSWALRWVLIIGLVAVLIYLVQRFLSFRKRLRYFKPKGIRPSAVRLAFSYDKLQHSKFPQKHQQQNRWQGTVTEPAWGRVDKLLQRSDKATPQPEPQGVSLSLLLAARAAERGMLPFYSLCGAMFIDAIPQRLYHLNQEYQAVLLSDIINIPDSAIFTHVLAVYSGDDEPILTIAAEMNQGGQDDMAQASAAMLAEQASVAPSWGQLLWQHDGFSHYLCMFFEDTHSNLGSSDRWSNLEAFETRALRLAIETLKIDTTPHMIDDGSSTKFVELTSLDEEQRKDLTYCLELHGMFMMVRVALQEDLSKEELEYTSLHRFRLEIYLNALASQTRIPIDIGMMILADLQIFCEHIEEYLEENSLSYLDVISPIYQEDTLFVPLEHLSWEERAQRQERIFDNPQLLSTIRLLMAAIETSADVRLEEQLQRTIPTFDV